MILTMLAAMSMSTAGDQRPTSRRTRRATPAAVAPANGTLGDIRMHVFYRGTGRLSPDISPPNEFIGWNTIIGESSAEESADDLLVVVEVRTAGEQFINRPLTITARAGRRVLGQQRFDSALTSDAGRVYLPLWLRDATCAGTIRVEVTFGALRQSEMLSLSCGE